MNDGDDQVKVPLQELFVGGCHPKMTDGKIPLTFEINNL
jgi:hypothetical protein